MTDPAATARPSNDFLAVRPEWLALHSEEVLEPDLPIVDPHHHLMDNPTHRYMLPEFLDDIGSGHRLLASLFVECRAFYRPDVEPERRSLGETEVMTGVAALSASGKYGPTRVCAGIIGNVDLRFGDRAQPALEAHMAVAGSRFRGIRNVSAWHKDGIRATTANPPEGLLRDEAFRRGFAALGRLGLTFDSWLLHTQLDDLIDLARAFPATTIICDHVGGPIGVGRYAGQRDEVFQTWRTSMRELARCQNVAVKLGGLNMHVLGFDFHTRPRPPDSRELAEAWRPYVETCIEAFGTRRAMFESNYPVDKAGASWVVLWNAFKRLAAGASAEEKQALFCGTACRVYGLDLEASGAMVA
jgi:L-fuconolactonase